jgi:hypothetical protein
MLREIAILVVCAALAFGAGWQVNGWRKDAVLVQVQADYESKRADAEDAARKREHSWADEAVELRKAKDAEIAIINRKFNSTVAGLRSRPERPSGEMPSATPACAGSSGAQLARGDGEFLAGYAADVARLNAALDQCEAQYNQLRN